MDVLRICVPLLAYLVDVAVGDPSWLPHPVVGIGKVASFMEGRFLGHRDRGVSCDREAGLLRRRWPTLERIAGLGVTMTIVVGVYLGVTGFIQLVARFSPLLGYLTAIWLVSTTIAARGLHKAANGVLECLGVDRHAGNCRSGSCRSTSRPGRFKEGFHRRGEEDEGQSDEERAGVVLYGQDQLRVKGAHRLGEARRRLSMIVGRDTEALDEQGILRAVIETVAENTADGVVSPVFYAFIGGAPLAMAYRAINTLDSMFGYRNLRYLYFGWASARLDDLANYLPARVTGFSLVVAAWLLRKDFRGAWRMMLRDSRKHPSPNSGFPEATVAGALGIRLGGLNYYGAIPSFHPYLGEGLRPLIEKDVIDAVRLMWVASALVALTGLALGLGIILI